MTSVILYLFTSIGLVMFGGLIYNAFFRMPRTFTEDKLPSMEFYLYKIARLTGKSEYDVFCKSAEGWPVSQARIEQDFKRYLNHQRTPHYVNDFVRKNKKHIDELRIPPF
jgi:hypothetical protein